MSIGIAYYLNQRNQNTTIGSKLFVTKCGDGYCSSVEGCSSCSVDCRCKDTEYCDKLSDICRIEACGDEICSEKEKETCCQDCKCQNYQICNKFTGRCQMPIEVDNTRISSVVKNYLDEKGVTAVLLQTKDTYYQDEAAKELTLNCTTSESKYPCSITLIIDSRGNLLADFSTV